METSCKDAVVVGGGPAGLAAALALGAAGLDVTLLGPPHRAPGATPGSTAEDRRTAALFTGSIELLRNLGAWEAIAPASEPLLAIRIIDDTGSLLKAPEVTFTAAEVGLEAFGWNVPNHALITGLTQAISREGSRVTSCTTAGVTAIVPEADTVRLTTREGEEVCTRLVAGADGRKSISRSAAGIGTLDWSYPQAALVLSFKHSRPHKGISTEFHRPAGPFTTVPLPGNASSLVWVESPTEAQRLMSLDDDAMRHALEERLQGLLGAVGEISPRGLFPLSGLSAKSFGANRIALIGEAAHVIPPIGAQGLNLGLRDGAALAECVAKARAKGADAGSDETLADYTSARRVDIASRLATIDLLNRSLISALLPIHLVRGLGLHALKSISPLRRALIREGLQPSHAHPLLMQPGGLEKLKAVGGGDSAHRAA